MASRFSFKSPNVNLDVTKAFLTEPYLNPHRAWWSRSQLELDVTGSIPTCRVVEDGANFDLDVAASVERVLQQRHDVLTFDA